MKVIVIGATGTIGSPVQQMLDAGRLRRDHSFAILQSLLSTTRVIGVTL
jgi:uncharacterized protein YbjT (DUF2867 family)